MSGAASRPALWISTAAVGEHDALVHFFTPDEGALTVRARGLLKPGAKLAPLLQPADELSITLAGGRGAPVLTGVTLTHSHRGWRTSLHRLALVWFMGECLQAGSAAAALNAQAFQLAVNLLRSSPADGDLPAAAAVFALKLATLHGLLPDLTHCAADHVPLAESEPAFLLPSGEGLIGMAAYNRLYARTAAGLPRLDPARRARWRSLAHGPLLAYPARGADMEDAALSTRLLAHALQNLMNRRTASHEFLARQWGFEQ